MIEYTSGFRWCLYEQDRNGRQTLGEIQITHWSNEDSLISLYSGNGICERKISIKDLTDLGRYGFDGITLSIGSSVVILRNTGDDESGGLLIDFLNDLVGSINDDNESETSKNVLVDPSEGAKDPIAKFLEAYIQAR